MLLLYRSNLEKTKNKKKKKKKKKKLEMCQIIYLGIKYESNTQINHFLKKKISEGKHLLKVKRAITPIIMG